MIEYSKLPIALEYLEAAIEEREIHKRYFASMNLAGVAEELLGKIIRIQGDLDQLTKSARTLMEIQNKVKDTINLGFTTTKEFKKLIGSTKNSIKHMDNSNDLNAKLYFKVEDESKWLIQAAIRNLDILKIERSRAVRDFIKAYPES
jgi:hypothetical protein